MAGSNQPMNEQSTRKIKSGKLKKTRVTASQEVKEKKRNKPRDLMRVRSK
jgi:hypothetical protein